MSTLTSTNPLIRDELLDGKSRVRVLGRQVEHDVSHLLSFCLFGEKLNFAVLMMMMRSLPIRTAKFVILLTVMAMLKLPVLQ
jgi:hypothetical protein